MMEISPKEEDPGVFILTLVDTDEMEVMRAAHREKIGALIQDEDITELDDVDELDLRLATFWENHAEIRQSELPRVFQAVKNFKDNTIVAVKEAMRKSPYADYYNDQIGQRIHWGKVAGNLATRLKVEVDAQAISLTEFYDIPTSEPQRTISINSDGAPETST